MAEGEVLETNRLGGEKRSSWDDCGNPLSRSTTHDCATSRQAETGRFRHHPKHLFRRSRHPLGPRAINLYRLKQCVACGTPRSKGSNFAAIRRGEGTGWPSEPPCFPTAVLIGWALRTGMSPPDELHGVSQHPSYPTQSRNPLSSPVHHQEKAPETLPREQNPDRLRR
jgi:hypothetical protein